MKAIKLTLPEFAFLDGNSHNGNTLENRTVVLHIRSATVLEFFHDEVLLKRDVIRKQFDYVNRYGVVEKITCAVHYSPLIEDRKVIRDRLLVPAIQWYKDYLQWEDENIIEGSKSTLN